ncbi:MAG: type I 3-dehydroquinate dehydratase [Planctomycetota bacterium]|nr:type I 3-dehydroquinate dehydratase [Planctomycetota bacterium]
MSLIAVSIQVADPAHVGDAIDAAARAGSEGAQLVEWRVDGLCEDEAGFQACRVLVEQATLPCILTCRIAEEGGDCFGVEPDRVGLIRSLAESGVIPRYIDIESSAWGHDRDLRAAVGALLSAGDCGLILSTHDFEGRPADLARRLDVMWAEDDVSVVKAAWRARSIRDSLEAFDLLTDAAGPMIVLCMDRFGVMTRVLTAKFGGLLTFASAEANAETAPGQPTVAALRDLYRFDSITPATKVYGIVGDPVAHSQSPRLHNAGFSSCGFDGVLVPMPVVEGWESFKASVASMLEQPGFDLAGLCVTSPHKSNLVRFVEEVGGTLTPIVHRCGAANTMVVMPDGTLVADNTDARGFVEPLAAVMELKGARVAVLGAGGAARAAVAGLLQAGAEVVIYNRSQDRAEALVQHIRSAFEEPVSLEVGTGTPTKADCFSALVNTTTVGMQGGPDPDGSPLVALGGDVDMLSDGLVVFESVYAPRRTPLVIEAEQRGAKVITGEAMFLAQAAVQFRTWTGQDAPQDAWRSLLG